jgi:hypothetical protein
LHASRNAIAALTESYEQKLLAWYNAHENPKAEHKTTKAKLEEERQQLEIARRAIDLMNRLLQNTRKCARTIKLRIGGIGKCRK